MGPDAVIEVSGLVKRYGAFQALHGIDLTVERGEVFGFIGPNGAGKTTLIRTMLDLIRPTAGSVRVLGLDSHRDAKAIHSRAGYVPGELVLWDRLTGRQALEHLAGLRGGAGASRIDALAERLDVELDRRISDLSKGNKEKIGLIQGFMHEPELVVLDEPTSGLDPLVQQEVFQIVDEVRERGSTVFFSSHHLDEVERIAERVGAIREGRMVAVDTVAGLKARAARRLEALLAGPVDAQEFRAIPGVRDVSVSGRHLHLVLTGPIDPVLKALARHRVDSLSAPEPELEEVFLGLFRGEGGERAA
ncbi:MAG: ABC transporter ATP-binding protein [Thermoleophilaceae bacterium]|nr:ABC transporter ATP-binding protein [Thermoleophilaceae bacterium]